MNKKMTVPVETAKAMSVGMPELEDAIARAVEAGWDALTLIAEAQEDGTYDVSVQAPTGVMVAWFLNDPWLQERVAVPGGEHPAGLHVTLGYFGKVADMTVEDQRTLIGAVGEAVADEVTLSGKLAGVGKFSNGEELDPFWVGVDIPGLQELRDKIVARCKEAGVDITGKGVDEWVPHMTVAYVDPAVSTEHYEFAPVSVYVDTISVAIGERRVDMNLTRPDDDRLETPPAEGWQAKMTKAVDTEEADRYTLGPLYIPGQLDAHGDWTDTRNLQKAVWKYVKTKEFSIRLQHNTEIVAGECVEVLTWPYEVTVPITKADGTTTEVTFPAGTPFMGTIWEPWAWELVQNGDLSGYSIGGRANLLEVDLGEDDVTAAEAAGAVHVEGDK